MLTSSLAIIDGLSEISLSHQLALDRSHMLDIIDQILANWVWIWKSHPAEAFFSAWMSYGIGTFFLFLPIYGLCLVPQWLGVKSKILNKIFRYAILTNALLALAPCALPLFVPVFFVWGAWQVMKPPPRRNQRRARRRRPEPDDDADSEEEE